MQDTDYAEFCELMQFATETTQAKPMSQGALELYFGLLLPYSITDVTKAISSHLRQSSFMPRPADIIKSIDGTPEERASLAWAKTLKAIADVGTYQSVIFDDPYIHYAVGRMGGWIQMGKIEEDQLRFVARDFERYYQEASHLRLSWNSPELQKTLIGITDAHATAKGLELSEPIRPHELKSPEVLPQIEAPRMSLVVLEPAQQKKVNEFYANIGRDAK